MALVADYSGSSSGEEEEGEEATTTVAKRDEGGDGKSAHHHISDDEDDVGHDGAIGSILDEEVSDIPGLAAPSAQGVSMLGLLAPSSQGTTSQGRQSYADDSEDLSDLPRGSEAERAAAPVRPAAAAAPKARIPVLGAARKRRQMAGGTVKIVLPSLSEVAGQGEDDDDDVDEVEPGKKRPISSLDRGLGRGRSGLLSMLPPAKNHSTSTLGGGGGGGGGDGGGGGVTKKMLVPDSVARKRATATATASASAAATNTRARPVAKPQNRSAFPHEDGDGEEGEGEIPTPFFTLDQGKKSELGPSGLPPASSSGALPTVRANPDARDPADRPLAFKNKSLLEEKDQGPRPGSSSEAVVGPSLPTHPTHPAVAYPEAEDLMANEDALNRLAGTHALRNKEEISVVDVKGSDLAADTREWLTKALTEEDTDRPGPRNTIKGQTRKKHQITYLAAVAKENEHKLKQQWATSAANKRAAGAKYGFF